jgi:hypothetical protein
MFKIYNNFGKRTLCSLFLFLTVCAIKPIHAQDMQPPKALCDSLNVMSKVMLNLSKSEAERLKANVNFKTLLKGFLQQEGAASALFDSVPALARLAPADKRFILYNWELPHSDGTFTYHAFVLHRSLKDNAYQLVELTDASALIKRPESMLLKPEQWFGAHYYKLVTVKRKGRYYYCLLGADWNDRLSKKKLIDVITFEKDGSFKFGAPIFNFNNTTYYRLIFEYSSKVSMSLNYDDKRKRIIFDHLSPIEEGLKGQYQFYAPDLSYDALVFKKGKWQHVEQVDARNEK